jgi:hypothetical protein
MNKKIILILALVLVILVSGFGFWFYSSYTNSQKVADSVNKNIDILNTNAEENKKILTSISQDFDSIEKSPKKETDQKISDIKLKIQEINNLSKKTSGHIDKLDKGFNDDTQKLYGKSKNSLEARSKALTELTILIENPICLIQKISVFTLKFEEAESLLNQVNSENDNTKNVDLSKNAANNYEIGANSISDLNSCLTSQLANYNTQSLKNDIDKDQKFYKDFVSYVRLLSEGLNKSDLTKITAAKDGLSKINNQKPVLFENNDLNKALEEFPSKSKQITNDVDKQEKELNELLEQIRKKYNFQTK